MIVANYTLVVNMKSDIFFSDHKYKRHLEDHFIHSYSGTECVRTAGSGAAADESQNEESNTESRAVVSIRIKKTDQLNSITARTLLESIEGNTAFNLFDLFNSTEDDN